jgi:hypothetical protein
VGPLHEGGNLIQDCRALIKNGQEAYEHIHSLSNAAYYVRRPTRIFLTILIRRIAEEEFFWGQMIKRIKGP